MSDDSVERRASSSLTDEQRYYLEREYKEPVEATARLEEVARFLVGATATTSGLFAAAYKVALGTAAQAGWRLLTPFLLWGVGLVAFLFVLIPERYEVATKEPAAWRRAYGAARDRKWRRLLYGTAFFIAGLIAAVWNLSG